MSRVQPVYGAVFRPRHRTEGTGGGKGFGNQSGSRPHSGPARGGRAALFQCEALQAAGLGTEAALPVGFPSGFADEHCVEIQRPRRSDDDAAASELARAAERSPGAEQHWRSRKRRSVGDRKWHCGRRRREKALIATNRFLWANTTTRGEAGLGTRIASY